MYGFSDSDISRSLAQMTRWAIDTARFNQAAAQDHLEGAISRDARFSDYDAQALAQHALKCRAHGAHLDLSLPELKGQEPRACGRIRLRRIPSLAVHSARLRSANI
jgi:hypothetical protein